MQCCPSCFIQHQERTFLSRAVTHREASLEADPLVDAHQLADEPHLVVVHERDVMSLKLQAHVVDVAAGAHVRRDQLGDVVRRARVVDGEREHAEWAGVGAQEAHISCVLLRTQGHRRGWC